MASSIADRAHQDIKAIIEKAGIEAALVIFQDPDSRNTCCYDRGPLVWLVGAAHTAREEFTEKFNAPENRVEEATPDGE